jgi:predicted flap endonuclease-1-like 5' DNA nuclease
MAKITEIEGVGEVNAQKLKNAGISTVEKLLKMGAEPSGRKEVASKTGFDEKLILKWVNFADLFRIKGVASEYSELLEAAGVDTVVELSNRNPENLQKKMEEVNEEKKLVRRVPTLKEVGKWTEQAKKLPRGVNY